MFCKKCHREISEESIYCSFCGALQKYVPRSRPKNANGLGTAYKRNNAWTIKITIGWKKAEDGHKIPIRRTKGGFKTRTLALKYASQLAITPVKKIDTLDQVWEKWKSAHEPTVGKSTMAGYVAAYKHFKNLHLMPVDKITANMLQKCIDECSAGKRTKQVMKVVSNLLMKYAMDDDQLNKNSAANLKTGKDTTKTREPITDEELETIRSHFKDEEYAPYVFAMCYLGFRPTEFLSMKKDAYHSKGDVHYLVSGEKTEAGRDREVTIPPVILNIVKKQLENLESEHLFPRIKRNRKGEFEKYDLMTEAYFREWVFKPMMRRLGIAEGKTPYSSRHTYADKMKNIEGADRDKAALFGHSKYTTTKQFYQSSNLEDKKRLTDQLK